MVRDLALDSCGTRVGCVVTAQASGAVTLDDMPADPFASKSAVPRFFGSEHPVSTGRRASRKGRCSRSRPSRVTPPRQRSCRGSLFLNNRYHDPALGSFLSVDPLVTTTGEPYIYASANPVTLSDPSGLCSADPRERQQCEAEASGQGSPLSFWWQSQSACARGNVTACGTTKDDVGLESLSPSLEGVPVGGPAYGSLSDSDGPGWLDRLGHSVRFAANLPLATPSVMWAEVTGGDCSIESGAVVVCVGMPGWANGPADSLTIGAIMSDGNQVSGQHLEHETNHVNQSAVLGPVYLQSWIAGTILSAPVDLVRGCQIGTHNPLEAHAGPGGGYGC